MLKKVLLWDFVSDSFAAFAFYCEQSFLGCIKQLIGTKIIIFREDCYLKKSERKVSTLHRIRLIAGTWSKTEILEDPPFLPNQPQY